MTTRFELVDQALAGSERVRERYGDLPTLMSIEAQLRYIAALMDGSELDRSRLKDIIVGVQAAREVESLDTEYAELLHEVAAEAAKMRFERA